MVWKDCGYLALSKTGKKVLIVIKQVHYLVDLKRVQDVLDGKERYTLIYEHIEEPEQAKQT